MDNKEIVKKIYQAYIESDREAVEPLIATDFHFTSPLDNKINRETYFERCWPHRGFIKNFNFIRLVENGNEVLVTYEGHTKDGKGFQNTEILTLNQGQIVSVEVYFGWGLPHEAQLGKFIDSEEKP